MAAWKAHVRGNWDSVRLRRVDTHLRNISYGEGLRFEVAVYLDGLKPEDVVVELLLGRQTDYDTLRDSRRYRFEWEGVMTEQGEHRFVLQITPEMCGKLEYRIRVYPWHELLTHPFEMGMMRWL
jgi:starch phosphorylase